MSYDSLEIFLEDISKSDPIDLVQKWLNTDVPHAFQTYTKYKKFLGRILLDWPDCLSIQVAGTSNWRYSLNPQKKYSEFHRGSDIDVVVVSPIYFEKTWIELRSLHRRRWYSWPNQIRENVLRLGQNVYCGFISPKHIPDKSNGLRFTFVTMCNSYSNELVGYRDVNMMFFKSHEDAIDYYVRGVRIAKRRS